MIVNGKGQAPPSSRKTIAEAIQSYLKEVHTLRGQRSMERDKWLLDLFSSVISKTYMDELSRDTLFFFMAYLKNAEQPIEMSFQEAKPKMVAAKAEFGGKVQYLAPTSYQSISPSWFSTRYRAARPLSQVARALGSNLTEPPNVRT
jgi:hypothetical protein